MPWKDMQGWLTKLLVHIHAALMDQQAVCGGPYRAIDDDGSRRIHNIFRNQCDFPRAQFIASIPEHEIFALLRLEEHDLQIASEVPAPQPPIYRTTNILTGRLVGCKRFALRNLRAY